jgi:hypothetical protein
MEKAPYPACQAKPVNAGDCALSHFERGLELLHKMRDGDGARDADGQMDVICGGSHAKHSQPELRATVAR